MLQLGFTWILEIGFRLFCLPNRLSKTKEKKVDAINPQLSERRRRGPSSLVKFCYILSKNKKENCRAQPDITSGPEVRQILKCPNSGLPVFFIPGLRTL